MFHKDNDSGITSVSAGVYVKLNGYNFQLVLEEEDFKPEDDFIPHIWEHHDDAPNHGANRDANFSHGDAS